MPCTTRSSHRARRTARACHSDSTQSHAARRVPATTAALESVKRLNRRLSSTQKHGRVLRRIHVQTDDVCGLLFKPWIVGGQVAVQPMRLQPRLRPHSLHGRVAEPPALPPSSGTANAWNHRKASAAPCARCGLAPPQSPRAFDYLCDAGPDSPSLVLQNAASSAISWVRSSAGSA
jgi:hypothetical protein